MPHDVTIRQARSSDAEALAGLRVALALEHDGDDSAVADFRERCRSFFTDALSSGAILAWLALAEELPVGIAVLELRATLPRPWSRRTPAFDGRVRSVFVEPPYRRRGVASALMREVFAAARAARVDRLTLGASEMGVPLYESLGFVLREHEMIFVGPASA